MGQPIKAPLSDVVRSIVEDGSTIPDQLVTFKGAFENTSIEQHFDASAVHLAEEIKLTIINAPNQLNQLKAITFIWSDFGSITEWSRIGASRWFVLEER